MYTHTEVRSCKVTPWYTETEQVPLQHQKEAEEPLVHIYSQVFLWLLLHLNLLVGMWQIQFAVDPSEWCNWSKEWGTFLSSWLCWLLAYSLHKLSHYCHISPLAQLVRPNLQRSLEWWNQSLQSCSTSSRRLKGTIHDLQNKVLMRGSTHSLTFECATPTCCLRSLVREWLVTAQ